MKILALLPLAFVLMAGCASAPNGTEPSTEAKRADEAKAYYEGMKKGNVQNPEAAARSQGGQ